MTPPLLTIDTAAAWLGLSSHTLRAHVRAGRIAHRRLGGRIRFTESDLVEFVEAGKVPAREAGPRPVMITRKPLVWVKRRVRP